jgi:hypothetical protein
LAFEPCCLVEAALEVPGVNAEVRFAIEIERVLILPHEEGRLTVNVVWLEAPYEIRQRDPQVVLGCSNLEVGPECCEDLVPGRFFVIDEVTEELPHALTPQVALLHRLTVPAELQRSEHLDPEVVGGSRGDRGEETTCGSRDRPTGRGRQRADERPGGSSEPVEQGGAVGPAGDDGKSCRPRKRETGTDDAGWRQGILERTGAIPLAGGDDALGQGSGDGEAGTEVCGIPIGATVGYEDVEECECSTLAAAVATEPVEVDMGGED